MGSSPLFLDSAVVPLIKGTSVLDVGCGYGRWGSLIRANYWEAGMKNPPTVDGLDAFSPNVDYCTSLPYYRKVWKQVLPSPIKGKWDTVLASEIIEHIPQNKVQKVLGELEAAANKRVILTTPNWPAFRDVDGDADSNKYEAHLSYVSRKLLKNRGYHIIGVGFGNPESFYIKLFEKIQKMAGGDKGSHRNAKKANVAQPAPAQLSGARLIRFQAESIGRMFPSQSTCIVAYKDIS